jgi:hypothetical protein
MVMVLDIWINNCNLWDGFIPTKNSDFSSLILATRQMWIDQIVSLEYQNFLRLVPRFSELENYPIIYYFLFSSVPFRNHISSGQMPLKTKSSLLYRCLFPLSDDHRSFTCFHHIQTKPPLFLFHTVIFQLIEKFVCSWPKGDLADYHCWEQRNVRSEPYWRNNDIL